MKRKHFSLLIIVLAISVIAAVLWIETQYPSFADFDSSLSEIRQLSDLKAPDKSVLAKMDRLERHMHLLTMPQPFIRRKADLSAMGYRPVTQVMGNADGKAGSDFSTASHRVTLAFDGQVKRFCIIDSNLYPEGAILPDGATILKIESTRVLIAKESFRQWLRVDPLFEATESKKS